MKILPTEWGNRRRALWKVRPRRPVALRALQMSIRTVVDGVRFAVNQGMRSRRVSSKSPKADRLHSCSEEVVPVVCGGAEALHGGMKRDHSPGHVVTGRVGIEAAVDLAALLK